MRVDIVLADAAESIGGKVSLLGGGWSLLNGPSPMAVVVFIEVPWDETNKRHAWELALLDADGKVVELPGPIDPQRVQLGGALEAGRPAGLKPGTPVTLPPVAVSFLPMPLAVGRYEFRFSVDGESHENWHRGFTVIGNPSTNG